MIEENNHDLWLLIIVLFTVMVLVYGLWVEDWWHLDGVVGLY